MAGLPIGLRVSRHRPGSLGFTGRKNYTVLREILSVCIKSDCDYLRHTDTSGFLPHPQLPLGRKQAEKAAQPPDWACSPMPSSDVAREGMLAKKDFPKSGNESLGRSQTGQESNSQGPVIQEHSLAPR